MRPASCSADRNVRYFLPHQYLAHAGEIQKHVLSLEHGWACRFRLLANGTRQITALFLPGDYCEPQWVLERKAEQSIVALTRVRVRETSWLQRGGDDAIAGESWARISRSIVEAMNRQSEWIVSLGRKNAAERLSDLFCDLFQRMRRVGLTYGDQCAMPLTQADLADIAGVTSVHVNRVLQELREKGLLELQAKWLRIPDIDALRNRAAPSGLGVGKPARKAVSG